MNNSAPRRSSLRHNVTALYALQTANYLIPLLTLPYLIRVLGAEQYGVMARAYAIVFFMVLFVDAGFNTLAARRLASRAIGVREISEIFATTQLIKLGQSLLMFLILCVLMMLVPGIGASSTVYLATFPIVLGSLLFPTWLFQGLEIMHFTTLLSVGGRLVATAGIFVLVQGPGDVVTAALLQASATALSGLLAVPVLYGRLRLRLGMPWQRLVAALRRTLADARSLAPAEFLSDALNNSGVFILGLFAGDAVVGIYAAIEKVARAAASLFQPLTKALFPSLAGHWMRCAVTAVDNCRAWSLRLALLAIATAVSLYAAAPLGLEIVFGAGWGNHASLLQLFAAWLALHVIAIALGQFWLLARGDRPAYTRCLIFTGVFQLAATIGGAGWLGAAGLVTALALTEMLRVVLFTSTIAGRRTEVTACVS